MTPSNPMQTVKVASKSKISKGKDTQEDKEVKHSSSTPKAATITISEAIDIAHKRKKPSSSSGKAEFSESLKELKKGVALILKGLWEVNIIDLSPLEVLFEDFFKNRGDYDATRFSISHKITRDSHQEFLSAAQQRLHTANEEKIKVDKYLGELQKVLERAEKELPGLQRRKRLSLIEEHQKKLSKNQESITNSEDEIHTINKISPLSETEIKELAKLKEDAETSRHQILSHKLFP
ncbi:hypothetical protein HAX54_023996 [Datura stramonium]|uniref:Uncharacterized protein n=1 Tax=Datura stramonium TaxID=4076 RepID=A0ABS8UZ81_DATST|nr:hypothetical protein [Datura stramonium]